MRRVALVVLECALLALLSPPAQAAPNKIPGCGEFDFLVGNWVVKDLTTRVVASDSVTKEDQGCTLIEKWRDASGGAEGLSVITYHSAQRIWHRDALVRSSMVLAFEGRIAAGSMVMTAKQYSEFGLTELHRISFTPKSDGTVEEVWQTSTDAGKSWQTRFDEIFTRIAE